MLPVGADEKPASLARQSLRKTNIFPSCSFGENRIFVNFGTLNTREPKAAVNLSPYISRCPYNLYPEISFSVEISALGATGLSEIKLPILNDTTNEPCVLLSHDPSAAEIISRIFEERMDSAGKGVLISTAIALLRHLKECLGSKLESLVEDYTLPILEKDSIEFIGTVTFDCLIVTPYPHPHADATLIEPHEIWNPNGPTQVVGHRVILVHDCSGRNYLECVMLLSHLFSTPFSAKFRVDVQMTRDRVPVIYHYFLVSESGAKIAPHNLSVDQFMHINELQRLRARNWRMHKAQNFIDGESNGGVGGRWNGRSHSLSLQEHTAAQRCLDHMKEDTRVQVERFQRKC
ncbi:hypothetical protein B0J14DRAFT_655279 [Halenospora varia]|nr:hypothetical protein B0J14DRAFT_655279 [Halenospora varia]